MPKTTKSKGAAVNATAAVQTIKWLALVAVLIIVSFYVLILAACSGTSC